MAPKNSFVRSLLMLKVSVAFVIVIVFFVKEISSITTSKPFQLRQQQNKVLPKSKDKNTKPIAEADNNCENGEWPTCIRRETADRIKRRNRCILYDSKRHNNIAEKGNEFTKNKEKIISKFKNKQKLFRREAINDYPLS